MNLNTDKGFELSLGEHEDLLDTEARRFMNMSGAEFERRWNAGEFRDENACPGAMRVAMLLPDAW